MITPFFLRIKMPEEQAELIQPIRPKKSFFDKNRTWLNILLLLLTLLSTFWVGISWSLSYFYAEVISAGEELTLSMELLTDPRVLGLSLIYAVVLLTILMAHEMGHYLACRYYRLNATLPFFIPAPTLIGTMGAFIRIRSPITRKHQLFDVGAAGPIAGFVLALPAVFIGLAFSKPVPALPRDESLLFGEPLLFKLAGELFFKDIPLGYDIVVHPIAFAGWVGVLVTALNLFPVGQLDGGHILYSILGKKTRNLARWVLLAFIVGGVFFWVGWLVWALLIKFIGLRHPPVIDEYVPLSSGRIKAAVLLLVIFIISFTPDPIQGYNLFDLIKNLGF